MSGFAPACSRPRTSSRSTACVAHSSAVAPSSSTWFTLMSGEVIAASTASRWPARARPGSVCGGSAAVVAALITSSSASSGLDTAPPEVGVVGPEALVHVIKEAVGILEAAAQVLEHLLVEHVLRAVAFHQQLAGAL